MAKKETDKREAILQASLEIFAENGFHSSPTSEISRRASVGTGTIYRYFESKDALIEALYEEIDGRLRPVTSEGIDLEAPVRENVLGIIGRIFRFLLANPHEFKFLEQYYFSPYGVAKKSSDKESSDRPIINILHRGVEQQIIKDLPSEILFGLCFGPVVFLARDQLYGYFELSNEMVEAVLESCWDSIKL
ncbi:MAG: TetR/AcrR family transcriptional regulator [Desulfuromusa sp.]|jgi:AcrR family transcriptional regulator|nr:TetR/AcrR family transcriptional regulator [Desulfuromusa sp.]